MGKYQAIISYTTHHLEKTHSVLRDAVERHHDGRDHGQWAAVERLVAMEDGALALTPRLLAKRRAAVGKRLRGMLHALVESLPLDAACDQFVCNRFLYDRMPPWLAPADRSRIPSDPDEAVQLTSRVRLVTKRCARLAIEEDIAALYHCCTNSMTYHGEPEPQRIDFAMEAAPALEKLIVGYPKYLTVGKLPADDDEQRLDIVRALAEAGVVMVAKEKSEGGGSAGAGSSSDSKRGNGSTGGGKKKRPRLS